MHPFVSYLVGQIGTLYQRHQHPALPHVVVFVLLLGVVDAGERCDGCHVLLVARQIGGQNQLDGVGAERVKVGFAEAAGNVGLLQWKNGEKLRAETNARGG